jgi:hypothetical protein
MRRDRTLALGIVLLSAAAHATNVQNGGLVSHVQYGFGGSYISAVAVNSAGNMLAVGSLYFGPTGSAPFTTTFTPSGIQTDEATFGAGGDSAAFTYVVNDSAGNSYIAGKALGTGTDYDWDINKLKANGATAWYQQLNGSLNGRDIPCGIAVDSAGNVFVAGTVNITAAGSSNVAVVKYAPNGSVVWQDLSLGPGGSTASAMCLAPNGHVYVAGSVAAEFAVMSVNGSGTAQTAVIPGSAIGAATCISSDSSSNILLGGYTGTLSASVTRFSLLTPTGTVTWTKDFKITNVRTIAAGAQLDANGNAIISSLQSTLNNNGFLFGDVGTQLDTYKYDPTKHELWHNTFAGLSVSKGLITPGGLVLDKYGDTYISGGSYFSNMYPNAAYLVKYNSAGTQMFSLYHGTPGLNETPTSLMIDANSDLYAAGYLQAAGAGYQGLILHWTQAPICNNDTYSVAHNTTLTEGLPGVLANDTFDKNALVTVHANPAHGTLAMNSNGSFKYTPTTAFTGTDTFQYTAAKSAGGGISNVATVTVHVT